MSGLKKGVKKNAWDKGNRAGVVGHNTLKILII